MRLHRVHTSLNEYPGTFNEGADTSIVLSAVSSANPSHRYPSTIFRDMPGLPDKFPGTQVTKNKGKVSMLQLQGKYSTSDDDKLHERKIYYDVSKAS